MRMTSIIIQGMFAIYSDRSVIRIRHTPRPFDLLFICIFLYITEFYGVLVLLIKLQGSFTLVYST